MCDDVIGCHIFNPSTSWICKSGVKLDYAPEDTLKSFIRDFTSPANERGNRSLQSPDTQSSNIPEDRRTPEGSLPKAHTVEEMEYTESQTRLPSMPEFSSDHNSGNNAYPAESKRNFKPPAPFLRRRQGMAAWCSKLRKQGLPIREPSEELRKKPAAISSTLSTRSKDMMQSIQQTERIGGSVPIEERLDFQNFVEKSDNKGLFSICMNRRRTTSTERSAMKQMNSTAALPKSVSFLPTGADDRTAPTRDDECSRDGADLSEFEMLEEMAERSSFSNMPTSHVSKLGQKSLRDRLQQAEEQQKQQQSSDLNECRNESLSEQTNAPQIVRPESAPERSILSILDKHVSRSTSEYITSRNTAGILTKDGQISRRKVARFHLVCDTSMSKDDSTLGQDEDDLSEYVPLNEQKDAADSTNVEFDDHQSWTDNTMEMSEVGEHASALSSFDLKGQPPKVTQSKGDSARITCQSDGAYSLHQKPSPMDSRGSRTNIGRQTAVAQSDVRSKSPAHQLRGANSSSLSYETEIITLADEFVDRIKRESPAYGRSNGELQPMLRQWIARLESEVKRFKNENANLVKLKVEREEGMRRLDAETKKFEELKSKEAKVFNDYKESEMKKLKKERRILEDYQRALNSMPNKRSREEIDRLKDELQDVRTDLSKREVRWHAAIARLRARNEEIEAERDQLKSTVQRLEQENIKLQEKLSDCTSPPLGQNLNRIRRSASSSGVYHKTVNSVARSIVLKPTTRSPHIPTIGSQPNGQRKLSDIRYPTGSKPISPEAANDTRSRPASTVKSTHSSPVRICDTRSQTPNLITNETLIDNSDQAIANEVNAVGNRELRRSRDEGCYRINGDDNRDDHSPLSATHSDSGRPKSASVMSGLSLTDEQLPMPRTAASGPVVRSIKLADGSLEETFSNGAVVVSYTNGSIKEVFPNGKTIVVSLFNGDIKRTLPDGRVIYHYAADGTVQITHADGTEEIIYSDGRQELLYKKNSSKNDINSWNKVETTCAGAQLVSRRLPNGDQEIRLPNGQREIHSTTGVKCRIYPDGTTKTVFPDGRHETRYSSGRLRIKDANGVLILDTRLPISHRTFPSTAVVMASPVSEA